MIIHVETLEDKRLETYVGLTEIQLRNRLEPEKGIFIAEPRRSSCGRLMQAMSRSRF